MTDVAEECLRARRNIRERLKQIELELNRVTELVFQVGDAHRRGNVDAARTLAADAGDAIYRLLGDCDATGDLETALWADDSEGWSKFMEARLRARIPKKAAG